MMLPNLDVIYTIGSNCTVVNILLHHEELSGIFFFWEFFFFNLI